MFSVSVGYLGFVVTEKLFLTMIMVENGCV